MFIDITEAKKPLEAEKIYNRCYRGGEEITPEVCMEVLRSTNYATCVKRMLTCVERLPEEKQGAFKEVVLATFTNREQPADVKEIGERLATASGYKDEFSQVCNVIDYQKPFVIKSDAMPKKIGIFTRLDYSGNDFLGFDEVRFTQPYVEIGGLSYVPAVFDFSHSREVTLVKSDLRRVKELRLKEGGILFLNNVKLKGECDFSKCSELTVSESDLGEVEAIKLKDGGSVVFCRDINLSFDLDVSAPAKVRLEESDLSAVQALRFKKGATVSLYWAKNLPEELDFSACERVFLTGCDLAGVKRLTFKNKAQAAESNLAKARNREGELCFVEKEAVPVSIWQRIKGLGR